MTSDTHFLFWMVIGSILLAELIYFLFCTIYNVYNNPRYHAFWAVFCRELPSHIKIVKTNAKDEILEMGLLTKTSDTCTTTYDHSECTTLTPDTATNTERTENIDLVEIKPTKQNAFLNFGLDTIIHCILIPLFLISILIYLCIRIKMEVINHNQSWLKPQNRVFCRYKLVALMSVPHHFLQIIFCISPLKIAFDNRINANKCTFERMFPLISIIGLILAFIIAVFRSSTVVYDVLDLGSVQICVQDHGIGINPTFIYYFLVQYYFCLLLTVLNVIIPLFQQKKMLKNLPNNDQYDDIKVLINKINSMLKRVCIAALIIIGSWLTINLLFWILPIGSPIIFYLSLSSIVVYTNSYLIMICVSKDWKRILCPMCVRV